MMFHDSKFKTAGIEREPAQQEYRNGRNLKEEDVETIPSEPFMYREALDSLFDYQDGKTSYLELAKSLQLCNPKRIGKVVGSLYRKTMHKYFMWLHERCPIEIPPGKLLDEKQLKETISALVSLVLLSTEAKEEYMEEMVEMGLLERL